MRRPVRTEKEAIAYLTDCTLATVSHMAQLKGRSKYEYERQISIAQKGVDWVNAFGLEDERQMPNRIEWINTAHGGSVQKWADQYDIKKKQ